LRLKDHAGRREQSRSMIAEAAIASFLSPDADDRREAALAKRLDRIDRTIQRLERDVGSPTKPSPSSSGSG
jgi:predicted transcriptional regulator